MTAAHLTDEQARIVNLAFDLMDIVNDEDQRVLWYCLDQLLEGGSPEYHEGGERPARDTNDTRTLIDAIKARLRAHIDLTPAVPTSTPRTWSEA